MAAATITKAATAMPVHKAARLGLFGGGGADGEGGGMYCARADGALVPDGTLRSPVCAAPGVGSTGAPQPTQKRVSLGISLPQELQSISSTPCRR